MSLESKLDENTRAVTALTEVMTKLLAALTTTPVIAPVNTAAMPVTATPVAPVAPAPAPVAAAAPAPMNGMPPPPTFDVVPPAPAVAPATPTAAGAANQAPFSDAAGATTFVGEFWKSLPKDKQPVVGEHIQTLLKGLGLKRLTDVQPQHCYSLYVGINMLRQQHAGA